MVHGPLFIEGHGWSMIVAILVLATSEVPNQTQLNTNIKHHQNRIPALGVWKMQEHICVGHTTPTGAFIEFLVVLLTKRLAVRPSSYYMNHISDKL